MFSYISLEERVPEAHPIREIRRVVDKTLKGLDAEFEALYAASGRPSIPPEQLLRALLLQIHYSIRSERQLVDRLDYDSIDGSLLEASASMKSFRPKEPVEEPFSWMKTEGTLRKLAHRAVDRRGFQSKLNAPAWNLTRMKALM